jgi:hypothetical protein
MPTEIKLTPLKDQVTCKVMLKCEAGEAWAQDSFPEIDLVLDRRPEELLKRFVRFVGQKAVQEFLHRTNDGKALREKKEN